MNPDQLLGAITAAVSERHQLEDQLSDVILRERKAILAAFDAGITPTRIAEVAGSSRAWVHKLDKERRGAGAPRRSRRRGLVTGATTTAGTGH